MTIEEFNTFTHRLFSAFPSLHEWLQGTYSPKETLNVWRKTLGQYTLAECTSVVDRWAIGQLEPFKAYERDNVHLLIRAIIGADRDRQRKRQDQLQANEPYRRKVSGGVGSVPLSESFDCHMVAAVKEGAVQHKRMLDGEIDEREYFRLRGEILVRHGI